MENYGPRIVTNGLVMYLDIANPKSYPGSGTTWNDISGNLNNATLQNSPTYNSSGYFDFNGTNQYVDTDIKTSDFGATYTISVWCKRDTTNTRDCICGEIDLTSNSNGVLFWFYDNVIVMGHFKTVSGNYDLIQYDLVANSIDSTEWHNYTISRQNGVEHKLYIDGVLVTSGPCTSVGSSTNNLRICDDYYNGDSREFDGKIGTFSMYNRVLEPDEVLQNYNAIKGRYNPSIIIQPDIIEIPSDGLSLHLDVDNVLSYPGNGTIWTDLAQNLTFNSVNTITPLEIKDGVNSFAFNGSGYWRCNTNFSLVDFGGPCTLIMWLYDEGVSTRKTIFEKAGTSYQSYEQEIAVTWEIDNRITWYSRKFSAYDIGGANLENTIPHATWTMVSLKMTTGKTTSPRQGRYSINGQNWYDAYTSRSSTAVLAAGEIRIGSGYSGTVNSGNIAMCLAYNRDISDSEILQVYEATKSRFI